MKTILTTVGLVGVIAGVFISWLINANPSSSPAPAAVDAEYSASNVQPDDSQTHSGNTMLAHLETMPLSVTSDRSVLVFIDPTASRIGGSESFFDGDAVGVYPLLTLRQITIADNVVSVHLENLTHRLVQLIRDRLSTEHRTFAVKPYSALAMKVTIHDPWGEILTSHWLQRPNASLEFHTAITNDQANRIRAALDQSSFTVSVDAQIEARMRHSATRFYDSALKSLESEMATLADAHVDDVFTNQEAQEKIRHLNVIIVQGMSGDGELLSHLPQVSFTVADLFDDRPSVTWGELSTQQRSDLTSRLSKLWTSRLTDEQVRNLKLSEATNLSGSTGVGVGVLPVFGAVVSGSTHESAIQRTLQETGITMRKVEGSDAWYPWRCAAKGFSIAKAKTVLKQKSVIVLNQSPIVKIEVPCGSIPMWQTPSAIEDAVRTAEGRDSLIRELTRLQQDQLKCASTMQKHYHNALSMRLTSISVAYSAFVKCESENDTKRELWTHFAKAAEWFIYAEAVKWAAPQVGWPAIQNHYIIECKKVEPEYHRTQKDLTKARDAMVNLFAAEHDKVLDKLKAELEDIERNIKLVQDKLFAPEGYKTQSERSEQ